MKSNITLLWSYTLGSIPSIPTPLMSIILRVGIEFYKNLLEFCPQNYFFRFLFHSNPPFFNLPPHLKRHGLDFIDVHVNFTKIFLLDLIDTSNIETLR
jgi:hypothetical protein